MTDPDTSTAPLTVCLTPLGEECHCERCRGCTVVEPLPPDPVAEYLANFARTHPPEVTSGTGAWSCPPSPDLSDREALRARFRACIDRLNARGLDGEAIARKASENLRHWAEHPAPWDHSYLPPDLDP